MRASAVALLLAFVCLGAGCGKPPPLSEFGVVAIGPDAIRPVVVQRGVQGEACFSQNLIATILRPPWNARLSDHGAAVRNALAKVPSANVMANAKLSVRVEQYLLFQRICAQVQGDAGRLE